MKLPRVLLRHPALAWIIPAAVALGLGALAMGAFTSSSSSASLPDTNPQALVAAMQASAANPASGYSGNLIVDTSFSADVPSSASSLSSSPSCCSSEDPDAFTAILIGSHTMRYWYGGPQRQRVAMLRQTSEADFFHDGDNLWEWDSATQTMSHTRVPATGSWVLPMTFASLTPQQLVSRALSAVGADTDVSIGVPRTVADRPCYELVITPHSSVATLIGSLRIGVDAATKVPLSVQIYAHGSSAPSVDATFSSVTFKRPAASYFSFTPPPQTQQAPVTAELSASPAPSFAATTGTGWTTVMEYRGTAGTAAQLGDLADTMLTPVQGKWGKGQLLTSPLLSVLAMNDGRVYLGAVDPQVLYETASQAG